ncbi:MAG: tyrosine-type recombinase/integrase [Clostridia bacterium]|nr:tyrosine-type recombinase/integrase [Clostridia bacterium]
MKKIRFHDLRHSCASVLLAQGVPMKQIQEWLGHSDMSTTANIYSSLDAVTKADTGAAMSKAFLGERSKEQSLHRRGCSYLSFRGWCGLVSLSVFGRRHSRILFKQPTEIQRVFISYFI